MKAFNRIFGAVIALSLLLLIVADIILLNGSGDNGREYRVEISRLEAEIREKGFESADLSGCKYVTNIEKYGENFYNAESDYVIREIRGELYRFDYSTEEKQDKSKVLLIVNVFMGIMLLTVIAVLLFIRQKILVPFEKMSDVPYQLSKGNLNTPLKENRSRFFGKFVWGLDMLRETLEQQKRRELQLQKEKKTLLLSLSHDIKTPLSAIKLYSKALSTGLYTDSEKQRETAESINSKADEIGDYVSRI
ncbi:MAG: histidine kinase dimerization/phospho-acceptor domain-containing protein, partial [Ruminiclostridium sp.]